MVLLITAGSVSSFWLWRFASGRYAAANAAADLRVDLGELIDISDDLDASDPASMARLDQVPELQRRIEDALVGIAKHGVDPADWRPIAERVQAFVDETANESSYATTGQLDVAAQLGALNDRTAETLQHDVGVEMDELRGVADRAASLAHAGVMGLSVVMLGGVAIGLRWDSRRRERAERAAAEHRNRVRFEAMVEHGTDLVVLTDPQGVQLYVSPALDHVLGFPAGTLATGTLAGLVHADDTETLRRTLERARDSGRAGPIDFRAAHGDGSWRTIEIVVVDMTDLPEVGGFLWTGRDVTDRRLIEHQLEQQAFTDTLTGLANRALFRDHLEHAAVRVARGHRFAVLLADLDGFKAINDALGHDAGDAVLVEIGARIASCVRRSDTVARLGGDEFAVLLDDIADVSEAEQLADRIIDLLRPPVKVSGTDLHVGISIGVACPDAETANRALSDADVAMYEAKTKGRGRCVVFEPAMHDRAQQQLSLASALAEAIDRGQLELHYQPTISLVTRKLCGSEALLRWRHPELGLVPPATFIPIAERSDLILTIGRWVLERACRQAKQWAEQFPTTPPLKMAINLSGRQLADAGLVDDVATVLAVTGVEPQSIILEITESVLMDDTDLTLQRLGALKELGVRLAIDDFGTGYSSLAYLRRFPVDILKIDRSFVAAAARGAPGGQALVRTMVDLAKSLEMETIAEGIEPESEAAHIHDTGCNVGQGFLFAPALDVEQISRLLLEHTSPQPTHA